MYADRKGWDVGAIEVSVDYEPPRSRHARASRSGSGSRPTSRDEQRERILVIAAKCPVHKTLMAQNVKIDDSLELIEA